MESQEVTYKVQIKAIYVDTLGYTTVVFENLKFSDPDYQYIMAVMFPNWDQKPFNVDDIGYANFKYVREGVDKWFDGKNFNTYQYTNVILTKFIEEKNTNVDIKDIKID